jgi:hypothetical protein
VTETSDGDGIVFCQRNRSLPLRLITMLFIAYSIGALPHVFLGWPGSTDKWLCPRCSVLVSKDKPDNASWPAKISHRFAERQVLRLALVLCFVVSLLLLPNVLIEIVCYVLLFISWALAMFLTIGVTMACN